MATPLQEYLDFAIASARAAGRLTLDYFHTDMLFDTKRDGSPVTAADRKVEELVRSMIEHRFPCHGIVGEEHEPKEVPGTRHVWYVDPIDGTKSFVRGLPQYAVLLGLEIDGKCEVGVAYFPALDNILYAASGSGCYWNDERTHVREADALHGSAVALADVTSFETAGHLAARRSLEQAGCICVDAQDAYGHALVATGRLDVMVDPVMHPWDGGPFPVILREAGGYFGDWSGNETIHSKEALSTTATLLPEILLLMSSR